MKREKLIIVGAGGHGRVIFDCAKQNGYIEIAFLDDNVNSNDVYGKVSDFTKYVNDYDFFVALGDNALRRKICELLLNANANLVNVIHPSAVIGGNVKLGKNVAILAGAIVNVGCEIKDGVIVNTSSSVDHDSVVGEYSHIAVGSHLCGNVKVGKDCLVGVGSAVVNGVEIADNTVIGAGGAVIKSIKESGVYVGVPVKKIRA